MAIITCPNCGTKNRVDTGRAQSMNPVCGKCHRPLPAVATRAATHPVTVTDADFTSEVLRAEHPVLVDFWAAWCGPCRMLAPTLNQLAAESGGRYGVAKLNSDENPRTAARYKVDALPTLVIFHRGKEVDRIVGLAPKPEIERRLRRATAAAKTAAT